MHRLAALLLVALPFTGCDSNEPIVRTCENESRDIVIDEIVTGTSPTTVSAGDVVTLDYTGTLEDGTVFLDEDRRVFGLVNETPGLQEGVFGMRLGSRRIITVPPYRGYSTIPRTSTIDGETVEIPPCSQLTYDVTLLDIGS